MKKTPNPTRMELLRLQKRRSMAQRGHKLLKDKLDGLIHQFMEILKTYRLNSSTIFDELREVFSLMILVFSPLRKDEMDAITFSPERQTSLHVEFKNIMGVKVPGYKLDTSGELRNYGRLGIPKDFTRVNQQFAELLPSLVKLAESKKAIELIAKEIYDVKRRVNALEFILIPELDKMIEYIRMKLEEMERASRVALIKIKEAAE